MESFQIISNDRFVQAYEALDLRETNVISQFLQFQTHLKELIMKHSFKLSSIECMPWNSTFPLRKLVINLKNNTSQFRLHSLNFINQVKESLEELEVFHADVEILKLVANMPKLKKLSLGIKFLEESEFSRINSNYSVECVCFLPNIARSHIQDVFVLRIFPNVKKLIIKDFCYIMWRFVDLMKHLHTIEFKINLDCENVLALARAMRMRNTYLPNVKNLIISGLDSKVTEISLAAFPLLMKNFPNLESFDGEFSLSTNNNRFSLSTNIWEIFSNCNKNLKSLKIKEINTSNISNKNIVHIIKECPNLKYVEVILNSDRIFYYGEEKFIKKKIKAGLCFIVVDNNNYV